MFCRTILLLCGATALAAQSPSLTLDDAIRAAWANDPSVAALALTPDLAHAREVQASIRPNPGLDLRSSLPLKSDSEWSVGAGVSQVLPRHERVELARALARLGGDASVHQLREQRRRLAGEVRRLFYDIAVHEARGAAARRTLEAQQVLAEAIDRRRAAGEIADTEWELLQVERARAEQAAALFDAELTGLHARLRRHLRWPAETPLTVTVDLPEILNRSLPAPAGLTPDTRPALALADLAVREAEAALALTRGETRADWTVGAGLDFERRANDATGRLENEPRLSVSASVPWPRRVANRGDLLEKQAALRIAEANRTALRDELTAELTSLLAVARATQPAVLRYSTLLASAAALPENLRGAFERGEVAAVQLAQAQQQQRAIETDFLDAAARYVATLAEAETAAGLTPSQP